MNRISTILNISLAPLVLVGLLLSHFALTDIGHGTEPDLNNEWWILRVNFLLTIGLAISSLTTARAMLRK